MRPYGLKTLTAKTITVGKIPEALKYVYVDYASGAYIDFNVTMHKLAPGLAFHMFETTFGGNASSPNTWTIDPGVIVAVHEQSEIRLGKGGSEVSNLAAVGTAADPIIFTTDAANHGKTPEPGSWNGILIFPDNIQGEKTKFDYVKFEYAGGMSPQGKIYHCADREDQAAAIMLKGAPNNKKGPSITNSTFANSQGQAIRIDNNLGTPVVPNDYTKAEYKNKFIGFTGSPQSPAACE